MTRKNVNLKRKFAIQFIIQYIFFVMLSTFLIFAMLMYSFQRLEETENFHDFSRATTDYIENHININKNSIKIDEEIESAIKKQDGWIQIVDINSGEVKKSLNVPSDVSNQYSFNTLISVINNDNFSNYTYSTWKIDSRYIVIFGIYSKSKELLNTIILQKEPKNISEEILNELETNGSWYAIYDSSGKVKQSFNINLSEFPIIESITNTTNDTTDDEYNVLSQVLKNEDLLVIGVPNPYYGDSIYLDNKLGKSVLLDLLMLTVTILVLLFFISFYYAQKWGKPLLRIIQWIQNLASQNYNDPYEISKKKLNKSDKLFTEITVSLEKLTKELRATESYREELEKMREEWITGLSHDLKTPLSSILGYSILLKNNSYDWSPEEFQKIGETLTEKSEYISSLIEDLNLTYNLKHQVMPLNKTIQNVDQLIREIVVDYLNHPQHTNIDISYNNINSCEEILYPIDRKQFQRILNNLLANAVKYSKTGQPIQIEVSLETLQDQFHIFIKDNGIGMDENTRQNLFNRYYRGTSTTESLEGSGLGLAITKQLVQAHGGDIQVTSKLNFGTTISLYFPIEKK